MPECSSMYFCPGMMKRKGVRFPSCLATVMETKADEKREESGVRSLERMTPMNNAVLKTTVMDINHDGKAGE